MPNRMLREGILTSEAVNTLAWSEEVFYRRLMSVVDDFGRYFGSPKLLRAACYPLQIDKVSDSDIGKWLSACETAGLVRVYPAQDGKRYVELANFRQQVRAKNSKFPAPVDQVDGTRESSAQHMHSNGAAHAHLDDGGDEGAVGGDGEDEKKASRKRSPVFDASTVELPDWLDAETWARWCKDRAARKKPITEEAARLQIAKLDKYRLAGTKPEDVLNHAMESGHQGFFLPISQQQPAARGGAHYQQRAARVAEAVPALAAGGAHSPTFIDTEARDVTAIGLD